MMYLCIHITIGVGRMEKVKIFHENTQMLQYNFVPIFNNAIHSFYLQYNIKKKEELVEAQPQEEPNPLMRKKKTPEELAAEAEQEDLDDFTSKCGLCFFGSILRAYV